MAWRAKITAVSQVDQSGSVTVRFDVYKDTEINPRYSNLEVTGSTKAGIGADVRAVLTRYRNADLQAATIQLGEEVSIN